MNHWRHPVGVCLLAMAFGACSVTETGNPPFSAQMALVADSSDPEVGLLVGDEELVVTAAWVNVGDVRFVRATECDAPGETEIDVPGPRLVEIVGAPEVVEFTLADDDYCRLRVPLARVETLPAGAPAALADHSVFIEGVTADGTPFTIASRQELEADVRSRTAPFTLDELSRAVLLTFDLGVWLTDLDLASATVSPEGAIVVNGDENRDVLDRFEANAEAALRLFRDSDEDGVLDDPDRAELLAEGAP